MVGFPKRWPEMDASSHVNLTGKGQTKCLQGRLLRAPSSVEHQILFLPLLIPWVTQHEVMEVALGGNGTLITRVALGTSWLLAASLGLPWVFLTPGPNGVQFRESWVVIFESPDWFFPSESQRCVRGASGSFLCYNELLWLVICREMHSRQCHPVPWRA